MPGILRVMCPEVMVGGSSARTNEAIAESLKEPGCSDLVLLIILFH